MDGLLYIFQSNEREYKNEKRKKEEKLFIELDADFIETFKQLQKV